MKKLTLIKKSNHPNQEGSWVKCNPDNVTVLLDYMNKKYSKFLFIKTKLYIKSLLINNELLPIGLSVQYDQSHDYNYVLDHDLNDKFFKEYTKYNKRFLVFTPLIEYNHNDGVLGHIFIIIYDKQTNEIEVFDTFFNESITKHIIEYIDDQLFYNMKEKPKVFYQKEFNKLFIDEYRSCNKSGVSRYKLDGICMLALLWYLELRMNNLDTPREELLDNVIKELKNENICRILINYGKYLAREIKLKK